MPKVSLKISADSVTGVKKKKSSTNRRLAVAFDRLLQKLSASFLELNTNLQKLMTGRLKHASSKLTSFERHTVQ